MAVQFSDQLLDNLLAPGISEFHEAEIPDLGGECPDWEHWLSNLFLNSLFETRYNDQWKQAAITFIFRTQNALRAYHSARSKTLECIQAFKPGNPASKLYFEALSHWETVVLQVQIALDMFFEFIDPSVQATDDADRIREAANRIKHFAEDIRKGKNSRDLTVALWLAKDRLKARTAYVTYVELAENLREMGRAAAILQNPNAPSPAAA